jgi:putative ABC transport system permease protein
MVAGILLRKLRRDLFERKGALCALLLIVMIGVGSFAALTATFRDLDEARDRYYAEQRVGDFTVFLKRAPLWVAPEIEGLHNVKRAKGRIDLEARILLGGDPHPIPGRVISLPAPRRAVINDVQLVCGTWFSGPRAREVILNDAFAEANGLAPGDRIRVLLLDREHDLLVTGTAMSPEFVYLIPSSGGFAPDPARFGVMYLPEPLLEEAGDLDSAVNQIVGQVHDRSPRAVRETLEQIERRFDAFGVTHTMPYFEQPSIRFLADELAGLKVSATVMPLIFLVVAALILNVLMSRLVRQQRSIIGTFKALGFGNLSIGMHFASFGVAVGLTGGVLGAAFGIWMQHALLGLYRSVYALPGIEARSHPDLLAAAVAISVLCAILGTGKGLRDALRLSPAEAMRPAMPEKGGRVLPERIPFLWRALSFRGKVILRTIFRNPFRSGVSVLASVIATALIVASIANLDALDFVISHEFERISHEDVTVVLRNPAELEAAAELATLDRVSLVEPHLSVAATLSHGSRGKRTSVLGIPSNNRLKTPLDGNGRPLKIPEAGLVLTAKLAEILSVEVGDPIRFRPLIGERREVWSPVVSIVDTYLGLNAYANLAYLSRLIGEEEAGNTLLATTVNGDVPIGLLEELNKRPAVLGIGERKRSLEQIDRTFGDSMWIMIGCLVLFAGLIAFGSVLNAALVSMNERRGEVGTLRVIGYSPAQVASIFAGESALLNLTGIALGLGVGIGLTHLLSGAYSTELYRFPVVIYPSRLLLSAGLMIGFVGLAQLIVLRLIHRLPWLEVLNVKE